MKKPSVAAAVMVAAIYFPTDARAQVDVVESAPVRGAPPLTGQPGAGTTPNVQAEIFYQLQALQQEVLQLRGMVEEQAYELKRLKQQRLDDYLDLDRRLSGLGSAGTGSRSGTGGSPDSGVQTPTPAPAQPAAQAGDELQQYRKAIDLVLKQKDYDSAIAELDRYLGTYPRGRYAANAHYWLGEIYLLKNDLEQARQWFTRLLDGFADHRKAPDAKFKLGKVYDQMGDKSRAKVLLEEVAASGTDASRLARNYLAENF
ncbi:tol-pal system protein YbgF [Exilibacterium tricleocarpae]|uniref:Cell division coordinator CpoB n=1 Tax=Exilibacterium tricleocarpae TaxID=2591008 RepID=A0A545U9G8_9GAMM|nr:tol-pal system protein YbgF [Exilibacterium tricleocarpae]TQV86115.1 tol-pal system protein YbgF [Exilibacterium tricleocarpae]